MRWRGQSTDNIKMGRKGHTLDKLLPKGRCGSRWGASEQSGGAVADETCLNQQNSEAPESFSR